MHLRVDPFDDGHQIVKNVFCVVHSGIHEVPEKENKTDSIFNTSQYDFLLKHKAIRTDCAYRKKSGRLSSRENNLL